MHMFGNYGLPEGMRILAGETYSELKTKLQGDEVLVGMVTEPMRLRQVGLLLIMTRQSYLVTVEDQLMFDHLQEHKTDGDTVIFYAVPKASIRKPEFGPGDLNII